MFVHCGIDAQRTKRQNLVLAFCSCVLWLVPKSSAGNGMAIERDFRQWQDTTSFRGSESKRKSDKVYRCEIVETLL